MTDAPMDAELAALIESRTGPVLAAERTPRGFTSDYTGTVDTGGGRVFVKAVRDPGRLVSSLEREAAVNPAVRAVAAPLLWQARGRGWFVLGFGYAGGRRAVFAPGSADLPAVVAAVDRIGTIPVPGVARDWRENRYDRYADEGKARLFAGDCLLHGDINPSNLLVGPSGDVTVVDWAWPVRGAAFMDAACLAVQLIASGHSPAEAEGWAAGCSGWAGADPAVLDAFAVAVVRMYRRFGEIAPAPWRDAMTASAMEWAEHRGQDVAAGALHSR